MSWRAGCRQRSWGHKLLIIIIGHLVLENRSAEGYLRLLVIGMLEYVARLRRLTVRLVLLLVVIAKLVLDHMRLVLLVTPVVVVQFAVL